MHPITDNQTAPPPAMAGSLIRLMVIVAFGSFSITYALLLGNVLQSGEPWLGSLLADGEGYREGGRTGAVHHVALNCWGHDAMIDTLKRHGLTYRQNHVTVIDLKQIFVEDPNGVLIELNYPAGQH